MLTSSYAVVGDWVNWGGLLPEPLAAISSTILTYRLLCVVIQKYKKTQKWRNDESMGMFILAAKMTDIVDGEKILKSDLYTDENVGKRKK